MDQADLEVVEVSALQLVLEFVEFAAFFLLSHVGLSHDDRVDVPIKKAWEVINWKGKRTEARLVRWGGLVMYYLDRYAQDEMADPDIKVRKSRLDT